MSSWESVFASTAIKSRQGFIFHTLSTSEFLRALLLATQLEVDSNWRRRIPKDLRVAVGRVELVKAAHANLEVRNRVRLVLSTYGRNRLAEEMSFIRWDERITQTVPVCLSPAYEG